MGAIVVLILITPSADIVDLGTPFSFGVVGALTCR
jgi:hypothetical protein